MTYTEEALLEYGAACAAAEREACAAECDARVFAKDGGGNLYRREATASQCATAIRNRGNNPPSPKASLPVVNPSEIGSLYLASISERNL